VHIVGPTKGSIISWSAILRNKFLGIWWTRGWPLVLQVLDMWCFEWVWEHKDDPMGPHMNRRSFARVQVVELMFPWHCRSPRTPIRSVGLMWGLVGHNVLTISPSSQKWITSNHQASMKILGVLYAPVEANGSLCTPYMCQFRLLGLGSNIGRPNPNGNHM